MSARLWRIGSVSFLVTTILAAFVVVRMPHSPEPAAATSTADGAETVADVDTPRAEIALAQTADGRELRSAGQLSSMEQAYRRPPRPELAEPATVIRVVGGYAPDAVGVSPAEVGRGDDDAPVMGTLEIDADVEEMGAGCAASDPSEAGCFVIAQDGPDPALRTLDARDGTPAVAANPRTRLLDEPSARLIEDVSLTGIDNEWLTEGNTLPSDNIVVGSVPGAGEGSGPADQPQAPIGSIGGPQPPDTPPPAGGPSAGDPPAVIGQTPPQGSEPIVPGGGGSPPGRSVPTLPGGLGSPPGSGERPSLSSPPSHLALPVEIDNIGAWGSAPSPAQTPELGSLALFGTGAATMAGYVLVRVRAGRGRRK